MVRKTKERVQETRQLIIDAARRTFKKYGVGASSMERIARHAGLTRGAIYWHFKDKVELFGAVREDVLSALVEQTGAILHSEIYSDPLIAIEAALKSFFLILERSENVRDVLEIMVLRCEYVAEYSTVQLEVSEQTSELLQMLVCAYQRASACGLLYPGIDPGAVARDTWAFVSGLLYRLLLNNFDGKLLRLVESMVTTHMALRSSR